MNEEHELLYDYSDFGIPPVITIGSMSSRMEKYRAASDNLNQAMIKHILPKVIYPKIPVEKLYEPDYYLILRHLRILTWGPFWTAPTWICVDCVNDDGTKGRIWKEPHRIDLGTIGVLRPDVGEKLPTTVTIKPSEFFQLNAEVKLHLNRCQDMLFYNTKVREGEEDFRPIAAALSSVSGEDFVDITEAISWLADLPAVEEEIIERKYSEAFNVGLRNRAEFVCPKCGGRAHAFVPVNDYYFRPTKEDLQEWRTLLANPKK